MTTQLAQIEQCLAELKSNGHHFFDPVRYHHAEQLANKARVAREPVQAIIFDKVQRVLDTYQSDLKAVEENACRLPRRSTTKPLLYELNNTLNTRHRRTTNKNAADTITEQLLEKEDSTLADAGFHSTNQQQPNELQAYTEYRKSRKQFETDKLVDAIVSNQSEELGPLNPEKLLIRSLESMRELSPHYLNRFVSYIDTLMRLEQAE